MSDKELPKQEISEHLQELRLRLFYSFLAIVITFILLFPFSKKILLFLQKPLPKSLVGKLIFLSPGDALIVSMKVTLLAAIILSSPFWIYQFWKYVEPALYEHEKRLIIPAFFITLILFLLGVSFSYFVILPFSLKFLLSFAGDMLTPQITINNYVSFVIQMILAFGIIFLLPVVSYLLGKLGIINSEVLKQYRKYAIIIIFLIAAILTPPDIFSQIMLALPLLALYEISIIILKIIEKRSKKVFHYEE
ncbi:MAG TPA: twin-arginine translocase subunit TatC [Desulfurobacteriaceae bacterium]|nr:twin-arginine translocase subunit TatC [Desulfurobacteriaceae bacterium]